LKKITSHCYKLISNSWDETLRDGQGKKEELGDGEGKK